MTYNKLSSAALLVSLLALPFNSNASQTGDNAAKCPQSFNLNTALGFLWSKNKTNTINGVMYEIANYNKLDSVLSPLQRMDDSKTATINFQLNKEQSTGNNCTYDMRGLGMTVENAAILTPYVPPRGRSGANTANPPRPMNNDDSTTSPSRGRSGANPASPPRPVNNDDSSMARTRSNNNTSTPPKMVSTFKCPELKKNDVLRYLIDRGTFSDKDAITYNLQAKNTDIDKLDWNRKDLKGAVPLSPDPVDGVCYYKVKLEGAKNLTRARSDFSVTFRQ